MLKMSASMPQIAMTQRQTLVLMWNAVLTKLMGEHPDQSFDYVDSKGLPF
jgi:hypothetical protein